MPKPKIINEELITLRISKNLQIKTSKGVIEIDKYQYICNADNDFEQDFDFTTRADKKFFNSLSEEEQEQFTELIDNYILKIK